MKPRPRPSAEPHACVVLAVDTAQVSGWCLSLRGMYISSQQFDLLKHPTLAEEVCRNALELGRVNAMPVVMVYEKPFFGTSQGQYVGAWKSAWCAAGGVKTRFVGVLTSQWRARILGMARATREAARAAEQGLGAVIAGRAVGPDEAPAICIAKWGSHAGEVLKKLPKSAQQGAA